MLYIGMAFAAATAFTVGGVFMKLAHGLSRPWPSLAVLGLFAIGAVLMTLSVEARGELGTAYLVTLGLETVLAFALGALLFGEHAGAVRILGLVLLVAGMVLIEQGGSAESSERSKPATIAAAGGE